MLYPSRLYQTVGYPAGTRPPVPGTTIHDFDVLIFEAFLEKMLQISIDDTGLPILQLLLNRKLTVRDLNAAPRLSVAGVLIFGKEPQRYMYRARVSAVRWQGNITGETILDRQEIVGRLPQIINQAESFVRRNTAMGAKIQGFKREDRPQYPIEAVREAIVNAVAHRDYSRETSQIRLFILDERIEVHSPGGLPNSVTLENMKVGFSAPRKQLITQLLSNLGYLSSFGTGIPRMFRLMREHNGTEPELIPDANEFVLKLLSGWGLGTRNQRLGINPTL